MSGVGKRLLRQSQPSNLTFIGEELENGNFYPKMVSVVLVVCIGFCVTCVMLYMSHLPHHASYHI